MKRRGAEFFAWYPAALTLLVGCSTDASTVEPSSPWGAAQSDGVVQATPAPTPAPGDVTDDEIWDRWASSCALCGNDPDAQLPKPEEVMQALPPGQRAARIYDVLTRLPVVSGQATCLLWLIATTRDSKALSYISTVFDTAEDIATRRWADEPLHISNEADSIRAAGITAGALIEGPEALAFLMRGANDSSTVVRQAAAIALAKRPDFDDRAYLLALRDSLDPAQRPAVDEVL